MGDMGLKKNNILDKYIIEILKLHINHAIDKLKGNEQFQEIQKLAKELGFAVNYYCEFSPEKKYQLLLGFSVLNEKGEVVEVEEKDYLCPSTPVLEIDKKGRFKFFNTFDDDFLDSINWVIENLRNYR